MSNNSNNDELLKYINRKGGRILLFNGHQYYKNSNYKSGAQLWRCIYYKKEKCTGFVTVQNERVIKERPHTTCSCNYVKNDVDMTLAALKVDVQKSDQPIPKMYKEAVEKLKDDGIDFITSLPEFENVQHGLYSARNRSLGVQKVICADPVNVEIPTKFSDFILADYFFNGNRIVVFCSRETRKIIPGITEFFCDATYKSCPRPFYQLFTLHGEYGSSAETTNVIPLIFVLMCDKKEESYATVFNLIQSQLKFNPLKLHCDYEVAALNAITKIYPSVVIIGCYYHWTRCVWRKAKSFNCTKTVVERRIVALTAALPLLPEEKICEGWQYIKKEVLTEMPKFLKYIENYWIERKLRECISVFGERHRTNNCVEGFNSKMNRLINKNTVNILRLLNILQKIDTETHVKVIKYNIKNISNKRKRQIIVRDDAIRHIQLQMITNEISVDFALEKLRTA